MFLESVGMAGDTSTQRSILFLHIPKTAGTSFRLFMVNRFPVGASVLNVHMLSHRQKDPNQFRFVCGHVNWSFRDRFNVPPIMMTCLREPLERTISHFFFVRSPQQDIELERYTTTIGEKAAARRRHILDQTRRWDLAGFVENDPVLAAELLGNMQTRTLVGMSDPKEFAAADPAKLLTLAQQRLEECDLVLLTECADESLELTCRYFGWDVQEKLPHDNANTRRPVKEAIEPATLDALRKLTSLDQQMYRYAEELFQRRLDAKVTAPRQTPPDATDFKMDQAIHGVGWFQRNQVNDVWFCWMGDEAELDLSCAGQGDHLLRCRVDHVIKSEVLDGLKLFVNGTEVKTIREGSKTPFDLTARVPGSLLPSGRVRLQFRVSQTFRPSDLNPDSTNRRGVSIAVSRVQLTPAARQTKPHAA
jgi:hypothetical protein